MYLFIIFWDFFYILWFIIFILLLFLFYVFLPVDTQCKQYGDNVQTICPNHTKSDQKWFIFYVSQSFQQHGCWLHVLSSGAS